MASNGHIQLPPDSTGKKVYTTIHSLSGTDNYVQGVHVVSQADPTNGQLVDNQGAAYVRFAEGEPKLDAYGNLKISRSCTAGVYDHSSDAQDDLYTIVEEISGTSTFEINSARIKLATDTTSGSLVQRTMNRYHYYNTGTGLLIICSMQCGDVGKTNNVRRWGYYDDNDGVFFQLSGTSLAVVVRSSIGGVTTDTPILQSAWNVDKLDGTGISEYTVSLIEVENYWVNIQWPGDIRFGAFDADGNRVECHNITQQTALALRTCTLPLRVENYNTGTTISTSELFEYGLSVYYDNPVDYTYWRYADMATSATKLVTTESSVLSVRAKTLVNDEINRINTYPQTLAVYVSGGPAILHVLWDSILSGATWSLTGESSIEGDIGANDYDIDNGYNYITEYLSEGINNIDLSKYFEINDEGILLNADATTAPVLSFVVKKLISPVNVHMTLTYRELR